MKTSELTGAALDWAVAKCEYPDLVWGRSIGIHHASHQIVIPHLPEPQCYWNPSTDWALGGPIIDREKFTRIVINISNNYTVSKKLVTLTDEGEEVRWVHGVGPTPLIAAMRCYVASKLGDNVDVPVELMR